MARTFLLDVKMFASIRVTADTEEEAVRLLKEQLDCITCEAGTWPDGTPIRFEASTDGEPDVIDED
ncbi:hypothetical protein JDBV08_00710 [Mycobacterium phage jiawei]|nr:hypothetical protein JDBV08_00710 [Mycobacterium phage jiawei]